MRIKIFGEKNEKTYYLIRPYIRKGSNIIYSYFRLRKNIISDRNYGTMREYYKKYLIASYKAFN